MVDANIAYIKTEPIAPPSQCSYIDRPKYRCTIELVDGSIIMRCGGTEQHALANAIACYRTSARPKADLQRMFDGNISSGGNNTDKTS
jgi:hypothetical protein